MIRKILFTVVILLAIALVRADVAVIPPEGWEAVGYQYNMTLYARVKRLDGTCVEHPESRLAAFGADGQCRGVIQPIEGPSGWLFQMSIASDSLSEGGLTLKVLDAESGEVADIAETVDFASDAVVPEEDGLDCPLELHVAAPEGTLPLLLMPGWNLVALPFVPSAEDAAQLLACEAFFVGGEGVPVRATAIEAHRGYWLHVATRKLLLLERRTASAAPALGHGWQIVGSGQAATCPHDGACQAWDGLRYGKTAMFVEGCGYWVNLP